MLLVDALIANLAAGDIMVGVERGARWAKFAKPNIYC
jgi:hypothetical protein